jgi:hypothetical protein
MESRRCRQGSEEDGQEGRTKTSANDGACGSRRSRRSVDQRGRNRTGQTGVVDDGAGTLRRRLRCHDPPGRRAGSSRTGTAGSRCGSRRRLGARGQDRRARTSWGAAHTTSYRCASPRQQPVLVDAGNATTSVARADATAASGSAWHRPARCTSRRRRCARSQSRDDAEAGTRPAQSRRSWTRCTRQRRPTRSTCA